MHEKFADDKYHVEYLNILRNAYTVHTHIEIFPMCRALEINIHNIFGNAFKFHRIPWNSAKLLPNGFKNQCILLKCLEVCVSTEYLYNVLTMKSISDWVLTLPMENGVYAVCTGNGNYNTNIKNKHLTIRRKWCITSMFYFSIHLSSVFKPPIHHRLLLALLTIIY